MIHADYALSAVEQISDVKAAGNLLVVVEGFATLFQDRFGIALLQAFLGFAASVTAGHSARRSSEFFAVATADLVAQHAADDGTDCGAGNPLFVLDGHLLSDRLVIAFFTSSLLVVERGYDRNDIGIVLPWIHPGARVGADRHDHGAAKNQRGQ